MIAENVFRFKISELISDFDLFSEYLFIVKEGLEKVVSETKKNVLPPPNEDDSEMVQFFYGKYIDEKLEEIENYESSFPNLTRRTLFMTIYALWEKRLYDICDILQRSYSFSENANDNKRGKDYIDHALDYISRVTGTTLEKNEGVFRELKLFQQIRNKFAHADGEIKNGNNNRIENYKERITEIDGIEIYVSPQFYFNQPELDESRRIGNLVVADDKFITDFLLKIRAAFKEILEGVFRKVCQGFRYGVDKNTIKC